jgi:hypothetical protein
MRRAGRDCLASALLACLLLTTAAPAGAEPTTTVRANGDPQNRIDIAILGDGYTAADLDAYAAQVDELVSGIFAQEPFREYQRYFNVHRIAVTSPQSGADHPESGRYRDTALGASYDCGGVQRAICVDYSAVYSVAERSLAPAERDVLVIVVNDPEYGGSGGAAAVVSAHANAAETLLHELGHTLGGLADEYGGSPECAGPEPYEPNVTRETSRGSIKWRHWVESATPIPSTGVTPGVVGLFEGGLYCDTGIYRPTYQSKMHSLGAPFEQVNTQELVKRFYNWTSPIDGAEPAAPAVSAAQGQRPTFRVRTPAPRSHALAVNWTVNGAAAGTGRELALDTTRLAPGTHAVEAIVTDATPWVRHDPSGVLRDSVRWSLTLTPAAGLPNLRVTRVAPDQTSVLQGGALAVTDTVANAGAGAAASTRTAYYFSTDAARGASDVRLSASRRVGALAAGASSSGAVTATIPAGVAAGRYYLVACADDAAAVAESSETDNCRASAGTVAVSGPNLTVSAVSNPPASVSVGSGFSVTDTTRNGGTATAGASATAYWISSDRAFSSEDRQLTGTRAVASLAAGVTSRGTRTAKVPAGTPAGVYYLLACADHQKRVAEAAETDNCRASTTTATVRGANLVESAVGKLPATGRVGGTFRVTDTVRNAGNGTAAASTTRYFLSTDSTRSSGDRPLGGGRAVPAVAASATSAGGATVTIPTGTPRGRYYLLACADDAKVVSETKESDNCRASTTRIAVGP